MTHKKYRNATIKLIIGALLISMSMAYLNHHPAEKLSLMSGVEVLTHKASVRLATIQGKDVRALNQQYQISRYMNEVIYTAQHTSGCQSNAIVNDIRTARTALIAQDAATVMAQTSVYRDQIRQRENTIHNNCPVSQ